MYSQNNEEQIIFDYVGRGIPCQGHFKFLDIGSNDGITLSNTRALAERGWRGVCVEASPTAFQRLKKNYRGWSGVTCYNIALADYTGTMILHESGELLNIGDVALVSSSKLSEIERFRKTVKYNEVIVKCMTWEDFFKKSTLKQFEVISMDIEGCELDVLPRMDLSSMNVRLICIEWNGNDYLKHEYEKHLSGFKLIHTNAENLIYAR